jgi:hypothetical protein
MLQGNEWRVTILSATNEGTSISGFRGLNQYTIAVKKPNTHFLRVRITLERLNGKAISADYQSPELVRVEVRDSNGNKYAYSAAGHHPDAYLDVEAAAGTLVFVPSSKADVDYLFTVPDDATITDFMFSDLPPVRLSVK